MGDNTQEAGQAAAQHAQPERPGAFATLVRTIWAWFVAITWTLLIGIFLLPFMVLRMSRVIHWSGYYWAGGILKACGVRVETENAEKIYRDGPVIFLSNHQSMVDILVFYVALRTPFVWMAKSSLFKIPILGWAMSGAGYIPVNRSNPERARKSLYHAGDIIRKKKRSVIVFPEGTRGHKDGEMLPFKKGGFLLAKRAAVTLQPLTIHGAGNIVPPKQGGAIQKVYPGAITLHIHDPISPEEYADLSQEQLSAKIRGIIAGPLARLQERYHIPHDD